MFNHRFLSGLAQNVLKATISRIAKSGADGLVMWGSSADLNDRKKCKQFERYLRKTLGPTVAAQLRKYTA